MKESLGRESKGQHAVDYRWRLAVDEAEVEALHVEAFGDGGMPYRWGRVRPSSLGWVTGHDGGLLVGFANVAWDGDRHAFLLDVAVRPDRQHLGIGTCVVALAVNEARQAGCQWLHVDYESRFGAFYAACGFQPTTAGLIRIGDTPTMD